MVFLLPLPAKVPASLTLTGALLENLLVDPLWFCTCKEKILSALFPIPYSFRGKISKSDFNSTQLHYYFLSGLFPYRFSFYVLFIIHLSYPYYSFPLSFLRNDYLSPAML